MTQQATVSDDGGVNTPSHEATGTTGRFQRFEHDVAGLRLRSASAERRMLSMAVGAIVVGFVLILVAWFQASGIPPAEGAGGVNKQLNHLIAYGLSGVGVVLVGGALFVRYSLGQYLRYWIVRQVAEQQAQTDRVVDALERVERALDQHR